MKNGYILYSGPSLLDGNPIAVIATMSSNNEKTGLPGKRNMVQTWIIRTDIRPDHAAKLGADISVCGDCIHRPANQNTCYVTLFQAPLAVYRGYHRGIYSTDLEEFYSLAKGRKVRFGAYGDPAAAPLSVWEPITKIAQGWTGYTHQWERPGFDRELLQYVMASVDTPEQAEKVRSRYFRVKTPEMPALPGEVECLSDSKGIKCADCLLCDGDSRGKGKSVYINVHGTKSGNFNPDLIAVG